jgi:acyl carrier protein
MKTVYQRVSEIVMSIGVTEREIYPTAVFSTDLGLDSLDMAELITLCEEEFKIDIPDSAVYHFIRVEDVVRYIQDKLHPVEKLQTVNEESVVSRIATFVGISKLRKIG